MKKIVFFLLVFLSIGTLVFGQETTKGGMKATQAAAIIIIVASILFLDEFIRQRRGKKLINPLTGGEPFAPDGVGPSEIYDFAKDIIKKRYPTLGIRIVDIYIGRLYAFGKIKYKDGKVVKTFFDCIPTYAVGIEKEGVRFGYLDPIFILVDNGGICKTWKADGFTSEGTVLPDGTVVPFRQTDTTPVTQIPDKKISGLGILGIIVIFLTCSSFVGGSESIQEDWTAFLPVILVVSIITITTVIGIFEKRKVKKYDG